MIIRVPLEAPMMTRLAQGRFLLYTMVGIMLESGRMPGTIWFLCNRHCVVNSSVLNAQSRG